jgi:DNA-binding IclR family transcriptional regulator
MPKWGFLTNHATVLIHVFEHPRSTLREIANAVGITERAALSILRQLEEEDCVRRTKEGRRNHYEVNLHAILASQTKGPYTVEEIVRALANLISRLRAETAGNAGGTAAGSMAAQRP